MGDGTEAERGFIFDWEILLDANIVKKSKREVNLLLSRVYIDDTDLTESDGTGGWEQVSDISEEMAELATISPKREEEEEEPPVAVSVVDARLPGVDIAAEIEKLLPPSSAAAPSPPSSAASPQPAADYGQVKNAYRSSSSLDFAGYWAAVGSYLTAKYTPLALDGEMGRVVAEGPPSAILKCHQQPKHFKQLLESLPDVAAAGGKELYVRLYVERLRGLVEKDFFIHKAHTFNNRCNTFLSKMAKMDYAHGYKTKLPATAPTAEEDPEEMVDVYYETYTPACEHRQVYRSRRSDVGERSLEEEAEACNAIMDGSGNSDPIPAEVPFDFSFNPKRDSKLVAKRARKFYGRNKDLRKYWFQRYRLFSRINEGILMDEEGWFSVTPERIAEHIADRMVTRPGCLILDAFTGVGGNAIQFALKGSHVLAVDLDPVKIRCAARNAGVYGVAEKITFVCGNFFDIAKALLQFKHWRGVDAVFLSPPWGGPCYLQAECFDLAIDMTPNGFDIMEAARNLSPNICLFLPRKTSIKQLISMAGEGGRVETEQNVLNGKVKTISAYFGNLIAS